MCMHPRPAVYSLLCGALLCMMSLGQSAPPFVAETRPLPCYIALI